MRALLVALVFAVAAGPALADDPACGDATFLLDTVNDFLRDVEMVNFGQRQVDSLGRSAKSVAEYGADAIARTTDEGWPADYLETLGKLVTLGAAIEVREGVLEADDAATVRTYGKALKAATAERCGAEDIPVLVEAGGIACSTAVRYVEMLDRHLPSFADNPFAVITLGVGAQQAFRDTVAAKWPAAATGAIELTAATFDDIQKGKKPANPDEAAAIIALTGMVVAEARAICPTDTFPDLSSGI